MFNTTSTIPNSDINSNSKRNKKTKKELDEEKERQQRQRDDNTFHLLKGILEVNRYPKLYEVLECSPDCTPSRIKEQYRSLSLRHHPDRGGSGSKMSKINEAYDILSDNNKRQIYDTLGSNYFINEINEYLKVPRTLFNYLPLFLNAAIDKALNLKDIIINSAINGNSEKIETKLGYAHIIGFPLVHYLVESNTSKFLGQRFGKRINNTENSNNNGFNINGVLSEIIATLIASPFEIIAFKAYGCGFEIKNLSNFFTFPKNVDKKATLVYDGIYKGDFLSIGTNKERKNPFVFLLQILPNIKEYIRIYQTSWKHIIGMILFRLLFSSSMDFISYFSDYFQHKYLETLYLIEQNEKYKDVYSKELNELNGEDNNNIISQNVIKRLRMVALKYRFASAVIKVASYGIPCYLFSVHRLFFKIENPDSNYFTINLLKSSLTEAFSYYIFDKTTSFLQKGVYITNSLIKDFLDVIYQSYKNNKQQHQQTQKK